MRAERGIVVWERLEPAWRTAIEEAWTAYVAGSHPIGAVVTDGAGQVLARGRNRVFDAESGGRLQGNPLAHAEINALLELDYGAMEPHECVLYTTTEPCPLCLGALYMSGVRNLYYAARDCRSGSSNLLGVTPYLTGKPVRVSGPLPEIEALMLVLQTEFNLRRDARRAAELVGASRAISPAAVRLGEDFYRSGDLWFMALNGRSASEAIRALRRKFESV